MYPYKNEADIPAVMSLLMHLGIDELKELLNNEDKVEEKLKDVKQLQELEMEKEMLMASTRSLAEFNLSKKPDLEEGIQMQRELSERGNQLSCNIQEKLKQLKERSGTMTVDRALDLLQIAAAEIEEETEKIAKTFLAGAMAVDEFLDQFLTRRNCMHLRKVKVDKMRQLMDRPAALPSLRLPRHRMSRI